MYTLGYILDYTHTQTQINKFINYIKQETIIDISYKLVTVTITFNNKS